MNYDLAKQLKEAGFLQEGDGKFHYYNLGGDHAPKPASGGTYMILGDDVFYHPTLEELIEACGDGFACLKRDRGNLWYAQPSVFLGFDTFAAYLQRSSAIEAVANLWLALNKK